MSDILLPDDFETVLRAAAMPPPLQTTDSGGPETAGEPGVLTPVEPTLPVSAPPAKPSPLRMPALEVLGSSELLEGMPPLEPTPSPSALVFWIVESHR